MSLFVTHLFLVSMCHSFSFSTIDKLNTFLLVLLDVDMCGGFPLSGIFFSQWIVEYNEKHRNGVYLHRCFIC